MNLWDKIRGYLQPKANRRRVLIGGVAVFAVIGLIIFGANLDSLFNTGPSRAGIEADLVKTWKNLSTGSQERAHAKSIVVQQGGKSWLYVIGGLVTVTGTDNKLHSQLLKTVERIEVNPIDGSPVDGAVWRTMKPMQTGHAEFGILQTTVGTTPYIYVVAGDIHVPPVDANDLTKVPILYSTVERLNLSTDNDPSWETVFNLTGVNFYPEVAMFGGRLNIVGGVYGNPFGGLENCGASTYGSPGTNGPLNPTADASLWTGNTGNKPTVGPNGSPILPVSVTGHTVHTVTVNEPVVVTGSLNVDIGSGATLQVNQNRPTTSTQAKPKWVAQVSTANAQATNPLKVTRPEAGIILKGGIKYPIVVENIPGNGSGKAFYNKISLSYSVNGNSGNSADWRPIVTFDIPTNSPGGRLVYNDWTVPSDVTLHALVRVNLYWLHDQSAALVDQATSGEFSINDSLAKHLSDVMISGTFVTTVSEHYAINLANPSNSPFVSELGNDVANDTTPNDFNGTLPVSPVWQEGTIMRLGHLRFTTPPSIGVIGNWTQVDTNPSIIPVPQGRYGHKLFLDGNKLIVTGGASWMPKLQLSWIENFATANELQYSITNQFFWVIANGSFPVVNFSGSGSDPSSKVRRSLIDGKYIGHTGYTLASSTGYWSASTQYGQSRAFFGLAKSGDEMTAVGGLVNTGLGGYTIDVYTPGMGGIGSNTYSSAGRVDVAPTKTTVGLTGSGATASWAPREDYNVSGPAVYNLSAFSLNDRMIAYGGQTQFCSVSTFNVRDPHVPNPLQPASNITALYQKQADLTDLTLHSWHTMADIGSDFDDNTVQGTGLVGTYYDNPNWQNSDNKFTQLDPSINFNWLTSPFDRSNPPTLPPENFSIRWQGFIKSTVAGSYTFRVHADDAVDFTLTLSDGFSATPPLVLHGDIGNDGIGSATLAENTKYAVDIRYKQTNGPALMQLFWTPPNGGTETIIPTNRLFASKTSGGTGVKNGTANVVFSADTMASVNLAGTPSINNFYIYRFGGFQQGDAVMASATIIKQLQGLGGFTDAQPGDPYIGNSSLVISPTTVAADGYTSATAIITLKDYYGQPVPNYTVTVYDRRIPFQVSGQQPEIVTITPLTGGEPSAPYNNPLDHARTTDITGQASFKITSATTGVFPMKGMAVNNGSIGTTRLILGPVPLTFTDIGVPDQRISTITTNKVQVVADGQDEATITVTLRGKSLAGVPNSPLPNYYVKIVSNRNVGDSVVDTITTLNSKTDSSGQAKFTLKSSTKGPVTISGYYATSAAELVQHPIPIIDTERVLFIGKIVSLDPSSAMQGATIPELIAKGEQTSWSSEEPNNTTVSFTAPAGISISSDNGLIFDANGLTVTPLKVTVANKPNTLVKLTITDSGNGYGSFIQAGKSSKTVDLTTNDAGQATVNYQSGTTTGVVHLEARVSGGDINNKLKLVLANLGSNQYSPNPYEVNVTASPAILSGSVKSSNISATFYRYTGAGKTQIKDPSIEVSFYVDDNGTFSKDTSNIDEIRGKAETTYTRGSQTGNRQVFAVVTYDGFVTAELVTIRDEVSGANIHFDINNLTINKTAEAINIFNVVVDPLAPIGFWNFVTTTNIGTADNPEFETLYVPFEVLPAGAVTTPHIMAITPNYVNAPSTDYEVTIEGRFTHFFQGSSTVTFTHTTDSQASGITFASSDVIVTSPTTIQVTMDVADAATIGYWDVEVDTDNGARGHEIAELAGSNDFLVTTVSGYQFAITANPTSLFRDGASKSQLITKVGKIDNTTGTVTPIDGVKLTYGLEGGTGGTLQKDGVDSDTTHDGGYSFNTYTTDKGSEGAEIYVRVSGTVDDIPLTTRVMIVRKVAEGDYITLVANPDSLPLAGGDGTSLLTATGVGADKTQPLPDGTVMSFLIVEGPGIINPAQRNTTGGVATATYYRPANLSLPTTVKVIAKATIPNVGTVFSNEAIINIGATNSDYSITLASDKSSVSVGGSDKATLTATLTYKGAPMNRYPINFSLLEARNGDYLTTISGNTNAQGKVTTQFVAGIYAGNIMVVATPVGLQSAFAPITKTADQVVDPRNSTISVVPALMPADNTSEAIVTVTLRNAQFSPLGGKSVTIASDRTADTLNPTGAQLTDGNGQAFFTIRSGSIGTSNVSATIGTLVIGPAQVVFEDPANLTAVSFDVKVPLEAKAYDRIVMVYLREKTASIIPFIQQYYLTNPSDDKLTGMPTTIYLHSGKTNGFWVKGRYHLARVKDFATPPTSGTVITLDFTENSKGLYAADLAGDEKEGTGIFPGFNDNYVNTLDIPEFSLNWFKNSYLADLDGDSKVTILDIAYWSANWFHNPGASLP